MLSLLPSRARRVKTIAVAIVGRAKTVERAIEKRSHETIYKTDTNIKQKC